MRYLLIIIFGFIMQSCCSKNDKRDYDLFDQYSFLLLKTYEFLEEDESEEFLKDLDKFVKENKDYNFNNGRSEYIISQPLFFNNDGDNVLIMILKRSEGNSNNRVEYFRFVSGYKKNNWKFRLDNVRANAFRYTNDTNAATVSEVELSLRMSKKIIETGYFKENTLEINDSFFESDEFFVPE